MTLAATMWVTQEAFDKSSETKLYLDMKEWVGKAWPFEKAAWPGKDIPLAEWQALPKK